MTVAEIADQIELADDFIELLREAISATDVDPARHVRRRSASRA